MQCPVCGAQYTWQGSMSAGGMRPSCLCSYAKPVEEKAPEEQMAKPMRRPIPPIPPPPGQDHALAPAGDPLWDDPDYVWRMYSARRISAVDAYRMLEQIRMKPKMLGAKDRAGKVIREIMHAEYFDGISKPAKDLLAPPTR